MKVSEKFKEADAKFNDFIHQWAAERGCKFIIENFDGRESPELIDGMAVDDVWGWMIPGNMEEPKEGEKPDDEFFGCIEWSIVDDKLHLEWNLYESE